MDPLTLAARLFMIWHPFRRRRERREAKRAALSAATEPSPSLSSPESAAVATDGATLVLPAAEAAEDSGMSEIMRSMGRSALKILGTALATYATAHGLIDIGQGDALSAALEAITGGVMTAVGLYLSHKKHAVA